MKAQYFYSENIYLSGFESGCTLSHLHKAELDFLMRESEACLTFHSYSAMHAKLERAGFSCFGLFGFQKTVNIANQLKPKRRTDGKKQAASWNPRTESR